MGGEGSGLLCEGARGGVRGRLLGAALLALLTGSCSSGANNGSGAQPAAGSKNSSGAVRAPDPLLAPFAVKLSVRDGACVAALENEPVDRGTLVARVTDRLDAVVRAQEQQYGEVREFPAAQLLGGPDVPWRCVGGAIFHLHRTGFAQLLFGGTATRPIRIDVPVEDPNAVPPPIPPQVNRIGIGPTGGVSWNGAPVTAERLSMHLRAAAAMRPEPDLEIDPSPGARLEAVISLLGQVRDAGIAMSRSDQQTATGTVYDDIGPWGLRFVGLERYAGELK